MKKYFDQKFSTKFSKQTMAKENGFQWVIKEMQEEFEYPEKDVDTFDDFYSTLAHYMYHVNYFIRIYEIDKTELDIKNEFLVVLSNIAKYCLKEKTSAYVLKNNKYGNFTRLYLLGILGSRIQKIEGNGSYDFGMFIFYNWFELYPIKDMKKFLKNDVEKILKKLTIKEKNKIIDIYNKNYNEITTTYKNNNLKSLSKYNKLFNSYGYKRNQFCTWQEDYLLKMSKLKISISEIIPLFSSRNSSFPNYSLWNKTIFKKMKKFFEEQKDAETVMNLMDYRLNNSSINEDTEKIVLNQVINKIKNNNRINDYNNIWFYILIKQMKNKESYIKKNINIVYIELKKKRNINIILFLKEKGFIIDKDLQKKIDKYYKQRLKRVEDISTLNEFIYFLEDTYIKKNINIEIINRIVNVFYRIISENEKDFQISSCFYSMISFLLNSKKYLSDSEINDIVLNILNIWNEVYYEKMKSLLHVHTYEKSVDKNKIENYNLFYMMNPILYLRKNFEWSEEKILQDISTTSEFALSALARNNTIYISEFLPYYKKIDFNKKDSLDKILCKYLDEMQIKYAEQLLNSNMEPLDYLIPIYKKYSIILSTFINAIKEENYRKMYDEIKEGFLKYTLLPYPEDIQVAHIVQLIPVLELVIRELGIKNKIIPFKENDNQFHVMKDSSTILLSIIAKNYKQNNNFENIEVYMYLYNYLYNVNSLNLRNELIHARAYLDNKDEMMFAFRVLIIGIFWASIELYM